MQRNSCNRVLQQGATTYGAEVMKLF